MPLSRTSTAKVVDTPGRALTVTGTSSVPALSATVAVQAVVDAASPPKAMRAPAASPSSIVTVAAPAPVDASSQPATAGATLTAKVSSSSTRSSSATGMRSTAVCSPASTVTVDGGEPTSAAAAVPPA